MDGFTSGQPNYYTSLGTSPTPKAEEHAFVARNLVSIAACLICSFAMVLVIHIATSESRSSLLLQPFRAQPIGIARAQQFTYPTLRPAPSHAQQAQRLAAESKQTSALDNGADDSSEDQPEQADPAELEAAMKALDEIEAEKKKRKQDEDAALAKALEAKKAADSETYKPATSTWGVFERPKDISKTYGGGKTIKLSASREDAERKVQEVQRLLQQLKIGEQIPPAVLVAAQNNMTDADRYLEKQNYQQAEYLLRCVRRALPFRNKLAGRATLELGTVLDAQGRYQEAAEMYRSLVKHPDSSVRKDANRLNDSFEALRFFKYNNQTGDRTWTDTIQPLLRRFVDRGDRYADYHATPVDLEQERATQTVSYLLVCALFVVPLAFVAWLSTVEY